jgi:hypothetical protein
MVKIHDWKKDNVIVHRPPLLGGLHSCNEAARNDLMQRRSSFELHLLHGFDWYASQICKEMVELLPAKIDGLHKLNTGRSGTA